MFCRQKGRCRAQELPFGTLSRSLSCGFAVQTQAVRFKQMEALQVPAVVPLVFSGVTLPGWWSGPESCRCVILG